MGCGSSIELNSENKSHSNIKNEEITTIQVDEFDSPDVRILLYGYHECGKTTIWRQFKRIYCNGFSEDERYVFSHHIKVNLISDIKTFIDSIENNEQEISEELKPSFAKIKDLEYNADELTDEIADEIELIFQKFQKNRFFDSNLMNDNFSFFLENARRIAKESYMPTDEDIIKSQINNQVLLMNFRINDAIKTFLVDVGGSRMENSRWTKFVQTFDYFIFVVSLSDFDQFTFYDNKLKRAEKSFNIFKKLINSPTFSQKRIFLVLNKTDVFEKKLKDFPEKFKETYPNYNGSLNDVQSCIEHVKKRYLSELSDERLSMIETETICSINEDNVKQLFQNIFKIIIENFN